MSLESWLKRHGDTGVWSQRQPLEPAPSFRNRAVAAAWEREERVSLHQLRRGVDVPSRLRWFRAIDRGWEEPDGMLCVVIPSREAHPDAERFLIAHAADPEEHARQLEGHYPYRLEVFQQWPGSRALERSLHDACAHLRGRGAWYRWSAEDVASLGVAMDLVTNAWAHRRYWFGLDSP